MGDPTTNMAPVLSSFQYDLIYNMASLGLASMGASTAFFFLRVGSMHEKYKTALCITGLVTFIAITTTSASSTPSKRPTLHARVSMARSTTTSATPTSMDTTQPEFHSTMPTAMSIGS